MHFLVDLEGKRIAFKNGDFSIQRLKNFFVCSFWCWTKGFIDVGPLYLINFDWEGPN